MFWVFLHDFGTKCTFSFGSLSSKPPCLPLFIIYLHDLGTRSRLNFWIWILQTTCFTAYLHDLGTKSRFSFRILIFQKKDETNVYKFLQKPLIHDEKNNFGNLTFRILILQTTWSWVFFTWFWDCVQIQFLGSLSSKPPGLQRICMILGLNLDSICGSWSFKKKDETNVFKNF